MTLPTIVDTQYDGTAKDFLKVRNPNGCVEIELSQEQPAGIGRVLRHGVGIEGDGDIA